ncbi:MAG: hypothetical protein QOF06_2139 [Solirubrobacterales bacterium]|jgi:hypothetical protein|nr:hypothetical protein [Solirubrobacterales bacterium]
MFSRIQSKFGTAGLVVAIVALVVALTGAAFAATGLNSKQKKEVTKIAKKYAGKQGPAGAQGPAGPAGKDGTNGTNGTDGTDGKSVVVGTAGAECPAGGATVQVAGEASTKKAVCNGEDGETGFTETLPSGETETGAWAVYNTTTVVPLSFNIPLEAAPTAVRYMNPSGEEKVFNPALPGFEFVAATHCTGDFENPTAPAGEVCVYAEVEEQPAPTFGFVPIGAKLKKYETGVTFQFSVEKDLGQTALGTWAVTAP